VSEAQHHDKKSVELLAQRRVTSASNVERPQSYGKNFEA
jgi:hypothetical protein